MILLYTITELVLIQIMQCAETNLNKEIKEYYSNGINRTILTITY